MFAGILLGIVLLLIEIVSYAAIWLAPTWLKREILTTDGIYESQSQAIQRAQSAEPDAWIRFDRALGWQLRTTDEGLPIRPGRRETHGPTPGPGVVRVATFGDSFVFCSEVADGETWQSYLESQYPEIEMMNYGVPAYGPDQAYLMFTREAHSVSPRVTMMGISTVSLDRALSVYRRFLAQSRSAAFLTKPRFEIAHDGELVLVPNPLSDPSDATRYLEQPDRITELGAHDFWYEPLVYENPLYDRLATVRLGATLWSHVSRRYLRAERPRAGLPGHAVFNPGSPALQIVVGLLERFVRASDGMGATPIVLLLPDRHSLIRTQRGKEGLFGSLPDWCKRKGFECLDASEAFPTAETAAEVSGWFMPQGHYSAEANRILSVWLGPAVLRAGSS